MDENRIPDNDIDVEQATSPKLNFTGRKKRMKLARLGKGYSRPAESDEVSACEEAPTIASEENAKDELTVTEEVSREVTEEVSEEVAEEVTEEPAEQPAEQPAEETVEEVAPVEEVTEEFTEEPAEQPAEETVEEVEETAPVEEAAEEVIEEPAEQPAEETAEEVEETVPAEDEDDEMPEDEPEAEEPVSDEEETSKEEHRKMVEELKLQLATPPRRRYIPAPKEVAEIDDEFTVDVPAKSEMKENVQAVFKALVKEGIRLGYLDKYDGLSASEIKDEYEGDYIYEVAEQELRKVALKVCQVKKETKVGVYAFSWDGSDVHHLGYLNEPEKAEKLIPYINDKDNYIFNVCGILTGGKYKSVLADEKTGKIKIKNCEGLPYGIELDIAIYKKQN